MFAAPGETGPSTSWSSYACLIPSLSGRSATKTLLVRSSLDELAHRQRGIEQSPCLMKVVTKLHHDVDCALRVASFRADMSCLCDARRASELDAQLLNKREDDRAGDCRIHMCPPQRTTHAPDATEVEKNESNLLALIAPA